MGELSGVRMGGRKVDIGEPLRLVWQWWGGGGMGEGRGHTDPVVLHLILVSLDVFLTCEFDGGPER